jgi:hypothetical protein
LLGGEAIADGLLEVRVSQFSHGAGTRAPPRALIESVRSEPLDAKYRRERQMPEELRSAYRNAGFDRMSLMDERVGQADRATIQAA